MKNLCMIIREYMKQTDTRGAAAHSLGWLSVGLILGSLMPAKAKKAVESMAALGILMSLMPIWVQIFQTIFQKPYTREL